MWFFHECVYNLLLIIIEANENVLWMSDLRQTLQLDLGNFCSSNFFESVFRLTITA